jgi:flagellar biosynthesis activator protein FlaF
MRSAAQAYAKVAARAAGPRELESLTLLKAAERLQAVCDSWDEKRSELADALQFNRKLWTIFLASVTGPESELPIEIRQNIATLGVFVMQQTMAILIDPRRDQAACLININREIAAGLRG